MPTLAGVEAPALMRSLLKRLINRAEMKTVG